MDFRTRLREQIDYLGFLDKEVAAMAGISKRTLDSYVGSKGSIPSADIAVKLAKVLGVSVEYLVCGNESNFSETEILDEIKKDKNLVSLVRNYKKLSEKDKKVVTGLSKLLSEK